MSAETCIDRGSEDTPNQDTGNAGSAGDASDGPSARGEGAESGTIRGGVSSQSGSRALGVTLGCHHTCVRSASGAVRCWGINTNGELGLEDVETRGDEPGEMGKNLRPVDLGTDLGATAVAAGHASTCALVGLGDVKCWGNNTSGELGLGDLLTRGDDPKEMGDELPVVDLGAGRNIKRLFLGLSNRACALLETGAVRCWGSDWLGRLGSDEATGTNYSQGDEPGEMGDALPAVDVGTGEQIVDLAIGRTHSCALLASGRVKCWGGNTHGELGLGDTDPRGDQSGEIGDGLLSVDLGTAPVSAIAVGAVHSCALFSSGQIRCWGDNLLGQLGIGDKRVRGDEPNEMGDALPAVDLGTESKAVALSVGNHHSCALLSSGAVKCWGIGGGVLGLGDTQSRGDQRGQMGDNLPAVDLGTGRRATAIAAGCSRTCALLDDGSIKCWGRNDHGQLGLGDTESRGDQPGEMGDNLPAVDLGQ